MRDAGNTPRTYRYTLATLLTGRPFRSSETLAAVAAVVAAGALSAINASTFGLFTGAVGDDSVSVTSGLKVVTSPNNPWVAGDVGKSIDIAGAGAAGAVHSAIIAGFTSAGSITIDVAAVTTVAATQTSAAGLAVWGNAHSATKTLPADTNAAGTSELSDLVLVTLAAGGSTPLSLAARFGQSANVKDYGATGDGVTDDAAAIRAAEATGKPTYFPAGTYKMLSTVEVANSPALFSDGSAIIKLTTNITAFTINRDETVVSGLRFVGSGIGSGFTLQIALDNYKAGNVVGTYRNLITNCYFYQLAGRAVGISYLSTALHREGNIIQGCVFAECLAGYFAGTLGEYTRVIGCIFRGCTYGARVAAGNHCFVGCVFSDNADGLQISAGTNDSHGVAVGCQFNHNTFPVDINGISYGYTFTGCTFYGGTVFLVACSGVSILAGQLDVDAYSFNGSVGTVIKDNLMIYGYANAISNNVGGNQSRTAWLNNRELTGNIRPYGWGATLVGGYARADYAGGAAQTIGTGTTAKLNPKTLTANFTAGNAAYTADLFYAVATGNFTAKGYGDTRARVKLNVLLSGAGVLGLTYLVIKVNGTAREYVPLTIFNTLYMFIYNGLVHVDNADVLTFELTNGSGANVVIAATSDSFIEVEGL